MIDDTLRVAADEQKRELVGTIKRLSLNLVEKWRKIREANKYVRCTSLSRQFLPQK